MRRVMRFTATWCGPCKALAKTLEEIDTNIPIEVFDVDEKPEIASEYGIRGVPTMIMMNENIEEKRIVGAKTKTELERWIND